MRKCAEAASNPDDALRVGVNLTVEVHDAETGELLDVQQTHNLVTTAGRNLIRDALAGTAGTYQCTHLAVGSGTTAPLASQTALVTERARGAMTRTTSGTGNVTFTYFLGTTEANGYTLTEVGLFNASAAGTMFARALIDGVVKTSSVTVTLSWSISISAV